MVHGGGTKAGAAMATLVRSCVEVPRDTAVVQLIPLKRVCLALPLPLSMYAISAKKPPIPRVTEIDVATASELTSPGFDHCKVMGFKMENIGRLLLALR